MKKTAIYAFLPVMVALAAACSDQQGGNDFDTVLPDVSITIAKAAYGGAIGQTINLEATVSTEIAGSDLRYRWEVEGSLRNNSGFPTFSPLVDDEQQGLNIQYTCRLSDNIPEVNTPLPMRVMCEQISTGRRFYSNTATLTVTGINGLMILHGDDNQSDVGVLSGADFTPADIAVPEETTVVADYYSGANGGRMVPGKGVLVMQCLTHLPYGDASKNCHIYINTDQTVEVAHFNDFRHYRQWSEMFYDSGSPVGQAGAGKLFIARNSMYCVGFDNDRFYTFDPAHQTQFLFPFPFNQDVSMDGNYFSFDPWFIDVHYSRILYLMYCKTVNGRDQKGFVGVTQFLPGAMRISLLDTKGDAVPFNPGNMDAELETMCTNANLDVLAVLRGRATNARFPGQYFMVMMSPQNNTGGESGCSNIPRFIASLGAFPEIEDHVGFDFGPTPNMCYYATRSRIYHFGLDGASGISGPRLLVMTDGAPVQVQGRITMMKLLDTPNVRLHQSTPMLMCATYDGTEARLYAMKIDSSTGQVLSISTYDSSLAGWNFRPIHDVNIKAR